MSNPNNLNISQTELPEQQTETPEEGTSWSNPGEFPEFMPETEDLSNSQENGNDWGIDDWGDIDSDSIYEVDDWFYAEESENANIVEETPEQKAKREAELAEKERQERIQIELERWDEDDTLTDFKAENPAVFSSIRDYIGQGKLKAFEMSNLVKDKKDDVVKWFSDEQYSEALPKMILEFGTTDLQKGLDKTPQEMISLAKELEKFNGLEIANEDERRIIKSLRSGFREYYDENLYTPEVTDSFFDLASYMVKNRDKVSQGGLSTVTVGDFIRRAKNSEELTACLRGVKELAENGNMDGIGIIYRYSLVHDFDNDKLKAFKENVIPLMRQDDPEVAILNRKHSTGGSEFANAYGLYGAGDYVISALTSKISPSSINELLCAEREVPTTDANKFERNRLDALELEYVLYQNRGIIHDNLPGVHELLSAMLDYYDSRDDEQTHAEKTMQLQRIVDDRMNGRYSGHYVGLNQFVFDLSRYEKDVVKRNSRDRGNKNDTEISADVLRRLVANTANSTLEKPKTTDERLNELIDNLDVRTNETTGETYVDWKQTGELVKYINDYLIQHQGDIGIRPSMVSAISYTERMAMFAIKNISDKDWHELPFDPEFKEFVRLQELIGSDKPYNEKQFDLFYDGLVREMGKDFESDETAESVYSRLQQHVLQNLKGLATKYNNNPNTPHRAGSLWSGNLAHELIGLVTRHQ